MAAVATLMAAFGCGGGTRDAPPREPDAGPDADCQDCAPPSMCVEGVCQAPDDPGCDCQDPASCEAPRGCDEPPDCQEDRQCAQGQICQGGACVEGCRGDAQCAQGQICDASRCVEGCRTPSDCALGMVCQQSRCVPEPCAEDSACGLGARCVEAQCVEIGEALCEDDGQCGFRWRCSQAGRCHDGECLINADCQPEQWCREGICRTRRSDLGAFEVERAQIPGLTDRVSDHVGGLMSGYGFGGALLDFDGDRDLDLYIGALPNDEPQSPPCLYRNTSSPGALAFEAVEEFCQEGDPFYGAAGVDLDGDGIDELIRFGPQQAELVRFAPEPRRVDLLDLFPVGTAARRCAPNAVLGVDVDMDGRMDLVVACKARQEADARPDRSDLSNLGLRQLEDGSLVPMPLSLDNNSSTLALGARDMNDDGLLDILVANDTFSSRDQEATFQDPGGVYLRCPVHEPCEAQFWRWGREHEAWGSMMGLGSIQLDGLGEHTYIADLGPNRMVQFSPRGVPTDRAPELGLEFDFSGGFALFAWGVVVDDFDRNGLDDLLVTQGSFGEGSSTPHHKDLLLLQRAGAEFTEVGQAAGLLQDQDPVDPTRAPSRGAIRADLDGDGGMEIISMALEGAPRIFTERPQPDEPPRCTLIPRGGLVPVQGAGYALAPSSEGPWHHRDIQAQNLLGASPWILSSFQQGVVRFPSGAEVAFDCQGQAGPVIVEEPDWIDVRLEGPFVWVRLDAPWRAFPPQVVEVATLDLLGVVHFEEAIAQEPGAWTLRLLDGRVAAMVRIDNRWVGRWFALE